MSLIEDLVIASRTLAEHGVIDGYGHASVRSETDAQRYYMARAIAPELVTEDDILEFDLDSNALDARGRAVYQERFIHGEIYKLRPEINAIVHNHSPTVVPFACTHTALQPIFHMSAFIGLGVPTWDIRDAQRGTDLLVRTPGARPLARRDARQASRRADARPWVHRRRGEHPARGGAHDLSRDECAHAAAGTRCLRVRRARSSSWTTTRSLPTCRGRTTTAPGISGRRRRSPGSRPNVRAL